MVWLDLAEDGDRWKFSKETYFHPTARIKLARKCPESETPPARLLWECYSIT